MDRTKSVAMMAMEQNEIDLDAGRIDRAEYNRRVANVGRSLAETGELTCTNYANDGNLIAGNTKVESYDHARQLAASWNKRQKDEHWRVRVIRFNDGNVTCVL